MILLPKRYSILRTETLDQLPSETLKTLDGAFPYRKDFAISSSPLTLKILQSMTYTNMKKKEVQPGIKCCTQSIPKAMFPKKCQHSDVST